MNFYEHGDGSCMSTFYDNHVLNQKSISKVECFRSPNNTFIKPNTIYELYSLCLIPFAFRTPISIKKIISFEYTDNSFKKKLLDTLIICLMTS